MTSLNVLDVLQKVYGAKGLPFPVPPKSGEGTSMVGNFGNPGNPLSSRPREGGSAYFKIHPDNPDEKSPNGGFVRRYDDRYLGVYTFLPVKINGLWLPNPLIIITGEKQIIETDLVDVGTVFEKVFTKPYDISIICTLIGENGNWPESELREINRIWQLDDVVTLNCALTKIFLQESNNFVISKLSVLDNQGAENVEVIQIDGRSNVDFELEVK